MGTNMAAINQQKHLSLSFATKSANLRLKKLKNNKIILFFQYKNCSDSQIPRGKPLFNQLGRHVNAASRKSLEIKA